MHNLKIHGHFINTCSAATAAQIDVMNQKWRTLEPFQKIWRGQCESSLIIASVNVNKEEIYPPPPRLFGVRLWGENWLSWNNKIDNETRESADINLRCVRQTATYFCFLSNTGSQIDISRKTKPKTRIENWKINENRFDIMVEEENITARKRPAR